MSDLQVHVEGDKIVICLSGLRMALSPDVASLLSEMLNIHIPIAQTEVENIRARYQLLLTIHNSIEELVQTLHFEQKNLIDDLISKQHYEVALDSLSMLLGDEHKYDYLATYWIIDDAAQYHLRPEWKKVAGTVLQLISQAPKNSLIGQLWEAGSFDNLLFVH